MTKLSGDAYTTAQSFSVCQLEIHPQQMEFTSLQRTNTRTLYCLKLYLICLIKYKCYVSYMLFLLGFCTINQLFCYSCRKNKELVILLRMYFAIRSNFMHQQDIMLWVRIKVWLKIFPSPYGDCDIYPSSVCGCGQYCCRLFWQLLPLFFFVIILPDFVLVALVVFIDQ